MQEVIWCIGWGEWIEWIGKDNEMMRKGNLLPSSGKMWYRLCSEVMTNHGLLSHNWVMQVLELMCCPFLLSLCMRLKSFSHSLSSFPNFMEQQTVLCSLAYKPGLETRTESWVNILVCRQHTFILVVFLWNILCCLSSPRQQTAENIEINLKNTHIWNKNNKTQNQKEVTEEMSNKTKVFIHWQ